MEGTAQTSIEEGNRGPGVERVLEGNRGPGVERVLKKTTLGLCGEEPISRSMQLHYIPVTTFS